RAGHVHWSHTAPVHGLVVVPTRSDVSLEDARKAVHMFTQVRVPILGIVENMSYLICPHCKERVDVFSTGGGERTAREMNVNFLGALPLDPEVRAGGDSERPVAGRNGDDPHGRAFSALSQRMIDRNVEIAPPTGTKVETTKEYN